MLRTCMNSFNVHKRMDLLLLSCDNIKYDRRHYIASFLPGDPVGELVRDGKIKNTLLKNMPESNANCHTYPLATKHALSFYTC